jgi:hypothetical protein
MLLFATKFDLIFFQPFVPSAPSAFTIITLALSDVPTKTSRPINRLKTRYVPLSRLTLSNSEGSVVLGETDSKLHHNVPLGRMQCIVNLNTKRGR